MACGPRDVRIAVWLIAMAGFLDLDSAAVAELGIWSEFEEQSFVVKANTEALFSISHAISVEEPRDEKRYLACFCQTGHSAAADFRPVVFRETEKTMGYVFPVTTYQETDLLEGWSARFAEVGFRRLLSLETLDRFSRYRTIEALNGRQDLSLDEVFPDDLSVLVLGIEQLKQSKFSLVELQLALLGVDVWIADDRPPPMAIQNQNQGEPKTYRVRRASQLLRSDIEYFAKLFRDADRDSSEVGRFITYYQVVEYCIEKIFSWRIAQAARQTLTAWELRERLNDASSEKKRIGILASDCLDTGWKREASRDLSDACRHILDAVGEAYDEGEQWGLLLYRVRALIVHNQFRLLRIEKSEMIEQVNDALRLVCLELVACFKKADSLEPS